MGFVGIGVVQVHKSRIFSLLFLKHEHGGPIKDIFNRKRNTLIYVSPAERRLWAPPRSANHPAKTRSHWRRRVAAAGRRGPGLGPAAGLDEEEGVEADQRQRRPPRRGSRPARRLRRPAPARAKRGGEKRGAQPASHPCLPPASGRPDAALRLLGAEPSSTRGGLHLRLLPGGGAGGAAEAEACPRREEMEAAAAAGPGGGSRG